MNAVPISFNDASLLHHIYNATPSYFDLLGCRVPTLSEVERDIETALLDPRRKIELLYENELLIGSLDYKLNYPKAGDLTINLLMIREDMQSKGLGEVAIKALESRVPLQIERILASVLGENPRSVKFWECQGYKFSLDAMPILTWYAKPMHHLPLPFQVSTFKVASD